MGSEYVSELQPTKVLHASPPSYSLHIHSFTGAYNPGWTYGLPSWGFLITHIQTHGRLPWTSDQPVTETSTYTGQHNIETQQTNIHVPSGI
jgi:hypothetical protein